MRNHVCTNRTLLNSSDPLQLYETEWRDLYIDNATTSTGRDESDSGHHRLSNIPEMACSDITFFQMTDPALGNAGMAEVCDVKYTGLTREACRYEYREIQTMFWRRYSGMMRGLPKAWDVCHSLGEWPCVMRVTDFVKRDVWC